MKRNLALVICCAVIFTACSGTKWVRSPVAKEYDYSIALEQRQEQNAIASQQARVSQRWAQAEIERFLGDLNYAERSGLMGDNQQSSVFQVNEINRLAPVFAEVLAKADTSQRLRFISFNMGQGAIFSESRKTEGVVFIDSAGWLNIAFNYINDKRLPNETSAIYAVFSETDPLKVRISDTQVSAPTTYAEPRRLETGESSPLWVAADLGKIRIAIIAAPVPAPGPDAKSQPVTKVSEDPIHPTPAAVGSNKIQVEGTAPVPNPEDVRQRDIRHKLKYLKELYGEGLISEKNYEAKKKELLDKID